MYRWRFLLQPQIDRLGEFRAYLSFDFLFFCDDFRIRIGSNQARLPTEFLRIQPL